MKKNKQIENDKQGLIIILVLMIFILIMVYFIYDSIKESNITYEYAKNGEIRESKECYQREDGTCFCKEGNNFIQVDNYYEK